MEFLDRALVSMAETAAPYAVLPDEVNRIKDHVDAVVPDNAKPVVAFMWLALSMTGKSFLHRLQDKEVP